MIRSVSFEKTTYNESAVQVRGGHAGHRGRDRPRGGDRLPPGPRRGGRRRLRIHAAPPRHEAAAGDPRRPHPRDRRRQGGRDFLRGRIAPRFHAGHRHEARPGRGGDPHRPPLLPAADAPLRRLRHARASFAIYNTTEEVDVFAAALGRVVAAASARARPAVAAPPRAGLPGGFRGRPAGGRGGAGRGVRVSGRLAGPLRADHRPGRGLPPLPAHLKTEANRVHGCMATVHFSPPAAGRAAVVEFLANATPTSSTA